MGFRKRLAIIVLLAVVISIPGLVVSASLGILRLDWREAGAVAGWVNTAMFWGRLAIAVGAVLRFTTATTDV